MRYLVTNITINGNDRFEINLPLEYCEYGCVAKPYLRAVSFYQQTVNYEYTVINNIYAYDTQDDRYIPCIADLADGKYKHTVKAIVKPMPKTSMVVEISEEDLKWSDNDVQQAIFEYLMNHLELDFLVEHIM